LAPKALFQDLFNAELGAQGICGGCAVFEAGARLPCHRHEFDVSITIVQGRATCVVEGGRHDLSGNGTVLVPEGRCHYFINLTLDLMTMVWVYAGDKPDCIVMDETFCHPDSPKDR
jgi:mannose-6-phosphate isomerase-like protein (cupin superfamily)